MQYARTSHTYKRLTARVRSNHQLEKQLERDVDPPRVSVVTLDAFQDLAVGGRRRQRAAEGLEPYALRDRLSPEKRKRAVIGKGVGLIFGPGEALSVNYYFCLLPFASRSEGQSCCKWLTM